MFGKYTYEKKLYKLIEKKDEAGALALINRHFNHIDAGCQKWNVFVKAIRCNQMDVAFALLNIKGPHRSVMRYDKDYHLFHSNNNQLTKALLKAGANPNWRWTDNNTPLMIAIKDKDAERAKILIDAGADVNTGYSYGRTVLSEALKNADKECIEILLAAKANANRALFHLIKDNALKADTLQICLDHGGDINAQNKHKNTLLNHAITFKKNDAARLLIDAGADLNIKNKNGFTPLISAVYEENVEGLDLLLKAGANTNIKCENINMTAYEHAKHDPLPSSAMLEVFERYQILPQNTEDPLKEKYHFITPETVTEVTGKCPIDGVLRRRFNFASQNVTIITDAHIAAPLSFSDYKTCTKDAESQIKSAFNWLKDHKNGNPTPPFKVVAEIPRQHKKTRQNRA